MISNQERSQGLTAPAWLLPASLLFIVWVLAIRQLDLEWTFNPQYQYGWIVPFLTLLLWWRAWPGRPPPGDRLASRTLPFIIALFAILAIPLRIIQEANPDWRILNYYYTAQAIVITALLLDCSGGKAWLRYFIFPLLFPLVAVPWPSGLEHEIILGLQRVIASIGVEGASWMGWSSYQRGNLIVLAQGTVGIDEACSGIRSLQSCLMIALFLGDYFQLANFKRVVLVALAIVSAFILNALRAFFLIAMMELHGAAGLLKYHDPAGFGIAFASLLLLWITASFMARPEAIVPNPSPSTTAAFRFPKPAFLVLIAAWFAAEMLDQGWYLWHEQNFKPAPVWTLQWPLPRPNFKTLEIDDSVRTILRYNQGLHGEWNDQDHWELFFFKWNPSHVASGLAGFHTPDVCLPAAGFVMKEDLGIKNMEIRGLTLPVSQYVFQDPFSSQLFYVFQIVTDDRVGQAVKSRRTTWHDLDRLQAAWNGKRNPGQRSLLVVNQGAADLPEAELGLQSLLQDSLVISPTPASTP
jgi:exosortase